MSKDIGTDTDEIFAVEIYVCGRRQIITIDEYKQAKCEMGSVIRFLRKEIAGPR